MGFVALRSSLQFRRLQVYFHCGCAAIVSDSAVLRVAIDLETLSAFMYLSQRAAVVETGL